MIVSLYLANTAKMLVYLIFTFSQKILSYTCHHDAGCSPGVFMQFKFTISITLAMATNRELASKLTAKMCHVLSNCDYFLHSDFWKISSHLLHGVVWYLCRGFKHGPMVFDREVFQLRPEGLLLLGHHSKSSTLWKRMEKDAWKHLNPHAWI